MLVNAPLRKSLAAESELVELNVGAVTFASVPFLPRLHFHTNESRINNASFSKVTKLKNKYMLSEVAEVLYLPRNTQSP